MKAPTSRRMGLMLLALEQAGELARCHAGQHTGLEQQIAAKTLDNATTLKYASRTVAENVGGVYRLTFAGKQRLDRYRRDPLNPLGELPEPPVMTAAPMRLAQTVVVTESAASVMPMPQGIAAVVARHAHVPNSVFDIARLVVDDGGAPLIEDEKAAKAAYATVVGLGWKAPPAAVTAAAESADLVEELPPAVEAQAPAAAAAAAVTSTPRRADPVQREDFVCWLDNKGGLFIGSNGHDLDLPVEHTRKLFHYLDHLKGNEIVDRALGVSA